MLCIIGFLNWAVNKKDREDLQCNLPYSTSTDGGSVWSQKGKKGEREGRRRVGGSILR